MVDPTTVLQRLLEKAFEEDCPSGDITTESFVKNRASSAQIVAKEAGIFFGKEIVSHIFGYQHCGPVSIDFCCEDGASVEKGTVVCKITAHIYDILKIERVLLNLLQRLSGIATQTSLYVSRLNNPSIKVLDTRKTTPLWRFLEKKAVVAGGGYNHRTNLSDMVLLKENHLIELFKHNKEPRVLAELIQHFKQQRPTIQIEVEVEHSDQLRQWDLHDVDFIMFDNFKIEDILPGVEICKARGFKAEIEVSGNITLDTISLYSQLPVQRISVGSLTHSVKALDLSLRVDQ